MAGHPSPCYPVSDGLVTDRYREAQRGMILNPPPVPRSPVPPALRTND